MKSLSALVMAVFVAYAVGCGTSPQPRFFTLASEPPASAAAASAPVFTIAVGPVTVPELVDRPQFVLRSAPNAVEIAELARWAAPLKSEIPRVIADHLARLLDGARTWSSAQRAAAGLPDYRVLVDIQRFETTPGEGATLQALWTVRARDGAPVSGRSVVNEPAGAGYDELVAAHSRALAAVSRDIAAAITATRRP